MCVCRFFFLFLRVPEAHPSWPVLQSRQVGDDDDDHFVRCHTEFGCLSLGFLSWKAKILWVAKKQLTKTVNKNPKCVDYLDTVSAMMAFNFHPLPCRQFEIRLCLRWDERDRVHFVTTYIAEISNFKIYLWHNPVRLRLPRTGTIL